MEIPRLSKVEATILEFLAKNPDGLYGQKLVDMSEGRLARGSVYVTLNRMSKKKLVMSEEEPRGREGGLPRRVFKVTGLGHRAHEAHQAWLEAGRAFGGGGEAWQP